MRGARPLLAPASLMPQPVLSTLFLQRGLRHAVLSAPALQHLRLPANTLPRFLASCASLSWSHTGFDHPVHQVRGNHVRIKSLRPVAFLSTQGAPADDADDEETQRFISARREELELLDQVGRAVVCACAGGGRGVGWSLCWRCRHSSTQILPSTAQ